MESPDLDRRSADPSGSRKGPNPNRDYKQHFIRQKQRYDTASSDQVVRTRELNRASLKQMKLQEEIEFLLDAIAGEKLRRKQLSQKSQRSSISVAKSNSADVAIETTEKEDVKPTIQADDNDAKQSELQQVDDELDELMQEDTTESNSKPSGRKFGIRQSRIPTAAAPAAPNAESASASGSVKRRRASFSDTDDELLESAGLTSTKRARNE